MDPVKVLYIAQEIYPYLPESEISGICRKLPQATQEMGREIRTFMPRFGCINERRNQLHEVIRLSGMNLIIDDADHQLIIKVASIQAARMQVYFIDNDDYFHRKATVADENGVEFDDNDDRVIFFARGVLETVKKLRWTPDLIHCHGWMTAAVPLYVKSAYAEDPFFSDAKVVYSVYNDAYSRTFDKHFADKLLIDGMDKSLVAEVSEGGSFENLSKLAMSYSDGIIQGSESVLPSLVDYTKKTKKPFLPYQSDENYVLSCNNFYDEVLGR